MDILSAASLLRAMPEGYEEACFSTKAIVRRREIKEPNDLMLLVLLHLMNGCSLVEISQIATIAKLGEISDVAFMKRFANCSEWFRWIITEVLRENPEHQRFVEDLPEALRDRRLIALVSHDLTEKGASLRRFRLHYAVDLRTFHIAGYDIARLRPDSAPVELDPAAGKSPSDETADVVMPALSFERGTLVLADGDDLSASMLRQLTEQGCEYVFRIRTSKHLDELLFYRQDGTQLEIPRRNPANAVRDISAFLRLPSGEKAPASDQLLPVRLCFGPRVQGKRDIVVTSLGSEIPGEAILALCPDKGKAARVIRCVKELLSYGELPKRSESSILSWLNGKLMIALLMDR